MERTEGRDKPGGWFLRRVGPEHPPYAFFYVQGTHPTFFWVQGTHPRSFLGGSLAVGLGGTVALELEADFVGSRGVLGFGLPGGLFGGGGGLGPSAQCGVSGGQGSQRGEILV